MFDSNVQKSGTRDMEASMFHPLFQDLAGRVFGLLTVVQFSHQDAWKNHYYKCRCACGTEVDKRDTELRSGKFFTCGSQTCRFWEKVDRAGSIPAHRPELGPCWVWTGALTDAGYGAMKVPGSKHVAKMHVYSWELHHGALPTGQWVLHKCDNRACVNPSHLFLGTHQDNMDDMVAKGRSGKTHRHLSVTEKHQMRADYEQGGITYPSLAARYGVSLNTVGRVLRRGPS